MTESTMPNQLDSSGENLSPESTSEAVAMLPSSEQLEIAESILERMKPSDKKDIGTMIHSRGQMAGIILAALGIFWWLSVLNLGSDHEYNTFTSLISDLSFVTVSWFLPILVFFGSLLNAMGRHRGQPGPSMFAGILFLICLFFAAEPAVRALSASVDLNIGIWQTSRLLILGIGVFISANLFIEAFLLDWVKKLEEAYFGIEISSLQTANESTSVVGTVESGDENPSP